VGSESRSIAFDQAAEYYDDTRARPGSHEAIIGLLVDELWGRGRCLEIGVGTGRIALDLHQRGIEMAGVDLSPAMLRKLVEKAGGRAPFPVAVADATLLPVRDGGVGAAIVCHVLHLVDPWRRAVDELVRVVRPGGLILVETPQRSAGPAREATLRFWTLASPGGRPLPGLRDLAQLDPLLRQRGFGVRELPPLAERFETNMEEVIGRLEAGIYAGCWGLSEARRRAAAAATREWARQHVGALDAPLEVEETITWRAYDAPAAPSSAD